MAAAQKLPFRYGTVRRSIPIGTYPITPGTSLPTVQIPQVGFMAKIRARITGGYTMSGTPTTFKLLDGYDALISNVRVGLNNGSANIVTLSGVGVRITNKDLSPALPIKRGLLLTTGAQTFQYGFLLPINANDRRQFELGLINLQAPEIRATIDLALNPLSAIFTDATQVTNFTASVALSYEYFEIPDPSTYLMPPLTLVRTIEDAPVTVPGAGLSVYQVPRLGTMFDYHAGLVLANAYAPVLTNLSEFAWRYNKSDVQYDYLIGDQELYEAQLYRQSSGNTQLDPNFISMNLWAAGDREWNGGDFRDAIDTEENTTTESLITVSATGLDVTKLNALFHVRRVMQRIVAGPTS